MNPRNPLVSTDGVVGQAATGAQLLAADWSQHLGWFRFYFDDDRWTWSPQVERMHGYPPGATAPSTLLVLSHVHLDDYRKVAVTLQDARRGEHPFSSRHRILDTGHRLHHVVMVGAPFYDIEGAVAGLQGFCLDVTAVNLKPSRDGHPAQSNGHGANGRRRVRAARS
ncbi:PAS domain-containing protein [Candidatus Mycobacterium methanotrophicum]|uniref:PAS domain-containing protein n=1 Tax=Candidatus Mycobacterium methanotrophicum TaxID=2943498 RepID=A0ABY4QN83_9MYCO|nr:PAS domain-containing protein [Candidatus Mycobacterium methanotrophicum]UQX12101.1 PAS domain-containing protein [Candidatus Mycobacterium methanotrophicum]